MLKPFQHYQNEYLLTEPFGNNGFDYEKRSESHPEPYLRIAPLYFYPNYEQAIDHFQIGITPAFEILDEDKIRSFAGLINFLSFPERSSDAPIFVFDNHNHAFYFWHQAAQQLQLKTSLQLIHVDQHKDSRLPANFISSQEASNPEILFEYTNLTLNVGNFIPPAIKTGLLSEVINIDSETSIKEFSHNGKPFILDIDLDFFAPELDYIGNTNKISLIQKLLPKASLITIATSPYFIDQQLAKHFLEEIFKHADS
ncbi:UPF0489 family protein [Candidatus Peregrinibacteria bacterium]|nr:UPF0489 family protein [Candidatus Peregrinibacteria bacterium]